MAKDISTQLPEKKSTTLVEFSTNTALSRKRKIPETPDESPSARRPMPDLIRLSPTRVSEWLNLLSDSESSMLFYNVVMHKPSQFLTDDLVKRLELCTSSGGGDGKFWLEWARCWISILKPNKNGGSGGKKDGHPRHRIVVPKDLVSRKGQGKEFALVKKSVSTAALDGFIRLEAPDKSDVRQIRIHAHHIGWNASRSPPRHKPLQIGILGHQISHLCDRVGCVRAEHMEYVTTQAENNIRQKCIGMILVVQGNVIVQEQPCSHARVRRALESCCRKLHIVCLGEVWPELRDFLWPGIGGIAPAKDHT